MGQRMKSERLTQKLKLHGAEHHVPIDALVFLGLIEECQGSDDTARYRLTAKGKDMLEHVLNVETA